MIDERTAQRFWAKVAIAGEDDCWPWNGGTSGNFNLDGKSVKATKVAFMIGNGEIPEGRKPQHTCSTDRCCNPRHMTLDFDLASEFWRRVDKTPGHGPDGDCWVWTEGFNSTGYGQFNIPRYLNGGKKVVRKSHQMAYELTHGKISEGQSVCHTCDNRPCCNPNHLWLGTRAENIADMVAKDRQAKGEQVGSAKLTEEEVEQIIALINSGKSLGDIALMFNTSRQNVWKISKGLRWKHLHK